jgi:DNA-binding beta-propeller fold protein YncE/cytochrome c peroxidase/mono/diheme cytochrome c family protein
MRAAASCAVLAGTILAAAPARALTVDVTHAGPSVVGEAHAFTATVTGATGALTYEWTFGEAAPELGGAERSHTFTAPGLIGVQVFVTDASGDAGSAFFQHLVHHPLTAKRPTTTTSIVYDAARKRVYAVNQDNDTLTSIDADKLQKLAELPVYRRPESLALTPEGKLWIVHQDDYAVAVVDPDRFVVERGFRLPYASQPVGVAMSPTGDAAYITLMAVGKLLKLDARTGDVLGEAQVGPRPRGIAVSHDGKDVYVTRFISPDAGGEVVKVDAAAMTVATRILLKLDKETEDSDQRARGLPNYLFSVALTPDGRQAWIPGKKDNIVRGKLRDGLDITHDTTVRPLAAIVDTQSAQEIYASRVDLDDRSQPVHVDFSPYGNFAILTLGGSNRVEIRDVNRPTQVFSAIGDVGTFPRAAVLAPDGHLFVQGALSRNVLVYDMSPMLETFAASTPALLKDIATVASEKLPAQVLAGKKIFHDAEDTRMAFEGYMSCGACHFEGDDDGRVYDFSTRGEGLRNTPALLGRKGTGHGRLNWSGTLDEVQDFEHQIRDLFDGTGFLPDDVFHVGTRDQPLGDTKAGLSAELDALAAYLTSLDHVNPSPYRNPDGSLTADGVAGKALFEKLGCDFCHGGAEFTDSGRGMLHDVGTITALSGMHAGAPLVGIDTPTLLGVWETPPYLHDGSAPTLRDVLTTRNSGDLHGFVSALSSQQVDQLVAYLQQIDGDPPVHKFPFDPPWQGPGPDGGITGGGEQPGPIAGGCACAIPAGDQRAVPRSTYLGLGALGLAVMRRRGRVRGVRAPSALLALIALALLMTACRPDAADGGGDGRAPTDWSKLPAATSPDPELAPLGGRQTSHDRICARGRGDSFARALCGGGRRPEIRDMAELLDLVGLGDQRAFALTGNSTSLVAMSVSAINPRILVFPRVDADLKRPDTMTAVGFVRGEPFVELVSRDPASGDLNFYLVSFEQRCSYTSGGCDLASLLTEEIEHDWTAYSVYDQDDLEGTSFDCKSCHQPAGVNTKRILRMQELASPWMHWFPQRFVQRTDSDRALVAQFGDAHQVDAQYGGIPIGMITNALDEGSGAQLEALVRAEGFGAQPNPFDAQIATEMKSGASPTWQARFQAHLGGEAIAVPYPRIDVTDEAKRTAAVRSYQDVVRGTAARQTLADVRKVFSDDAAAKLSFVPQAGADGKAVLLQMCARCHDGRGNPQLSKNHFDVRKLDEMPRAEKDLAITRINETAATRMPPWRVGTLTPDAIRAATLQLQM